MLRTIACDDAYVEALARLIPEPQVADDWQRLHVERLLERATAFEDDAYPPQRTPRGKVHVMHIASTPWTARMLVYFTVEPSGKICLRDLAPIAVTQDAEPIAGFLAAAL